MLRAGHPEIAHGVHALAAQLTRFLEGHLAARVGQQRLLRSPAAVVWMAGARGERPDPHGMDPGHHHPHRHDADRDDAQGCHPEGEPLWLVAPLSHGSAWPQWEGPEPWPSPCMAQGIHWVPILWAPVQLKWSLAAFFASA